MLRASIKSAAVPLQARCADIDDVAPDRDRIPDVERELDVGVGRRDRQRAGVRVPLAPIVSAGPMAAA